MKETNYDYNCRNDNFYQIYLLLLSLETLNRKKTKEKKTRTSPPGKLKSTTDEEEDKETKRHENGKAKIKQRVKEKRIIVVNTQEAFNAVSRLVITVIKLGREAEAAGRRQTRDQVAGRQDGEKRINK